MSYLLDTNIFIRCKNEMPLDIYRGFWQTMARLAQSGQVFSSVKVKEEIEKGNDELVQWCEENLPKDFFLPFEANTEYGSLMRWANENSFFSNAAKHEFATVADAFIVVTAAACQMKVVSFETPDPNCRKHVKIPDACLSIGVEYCSLNEMLHELEVTI